jgi:hypothetical protein
MRSTAATSTTRASPRRTVGKIGFDELDAGRNKLAPAVTQVIEYNGIMPFGGEQHGHCPADVSGTAGNQDFHKNTVLS